MAEFGSAARERAFRTEQFETSARGVRWAVVVMVLGNLLSTWFDGRLFAARAPDHVEVIVAARIGVLIAVVSPGVIVQWWPRPQPFAWTLLGGCALIAAMQAVIAHE